MLRIDCQSHLFPAAYAELLTRNRGPLQTTGGNGTYQLDYWGSQRFTLRLEDYSVERKLRDMDRSGIDISVLSVNIPSPELLDADLAGEGARICNDYLADVCARHPDRFVAIASLPFNDIPATIAELGRAVTTLDLRGVFFCSNLNGKPLDAPELEPFYARVAALGVPLVLHPTVPTWADAITEYSMIPMMGFMVDTSFALMRMILGGVLERHPALQVVHPHAGGIVPYLMGRIMEQTEVKRRGREHIRQSPLAYYQNVYLDLVSPSAQALGYALEFARPDRLLFGSDHPWVSIETILDLVDQLEMPETTRQAIMEENACRLFKIQR